LGTAAQHAVESLRHTFIAGELKPGEKVRQEEIAERLGLSLAPVREALAVLEQEGQLTYRPRRGYFVTELDLDDLREIYDLRRLVEGRAARGALPQFDADALERIALAARDCEEAVERGDVTAELEANRRFHFAVLEAPDQVHTMRVVRLLWDSTETYRALYYNDPADRVDSLEAHARIIDAVQAGDADHLVAELDGHREAALDRLASVLAAT
jgi:DNA-binding GntR family transcriptional regulator